MVIGDIDVPIPSSASVASSLSNSQNSNPSPFVDRSLSSASHNYGSSMANSSTNRNISVQLELCRHQFLTTSRKTWESKTKAKGRATVTSMTQRTARGSCCECEIQGFEPSKKKRTSQYCAVCLPENGCIQFWVCERCQSLHHDRIARQMNG